MDNRSTLPFNRSQIAADLLICIALVVVGIGYMVKYGNFSARPYEDAAILMRYSQHLADNQGIVWNIGAPPVDGATDFLFMVSVAGLTKLGLTVENSVRTLDIVSFVLTIAVIYFAIRRLHRANWLIAAVSVLFLIVGPNTAYVIAYFGTPFFALAASLAWYFAIKLYYDELPSHGASLGFALFALITGLIRPEGVFLAGFMLLGLVLAKGVARTRLTLFYFVGIFTILGGTYFVWHWWYFGYPLPNTYYVKGTATFKNLADSLRSVVILTSPFVFATFLAFRSRRLLNYAVFILVPTVGFAALWTLVSVDTDFFVRFQYALLPMTLMAWSPFVEGLFSAFQSWRPMQLQIRRHAPQLVIMVLLVVVGAVLLYTAHARYNVPAYQDGRYDVAEMLRPYRDKNYTMAVSEAGLLPFYSGWKAVDTWGLNDAWIAHNGKITAEYLDRYKPELIMFHAFFSPSVLSVDPGAAWTQMTLTLKSYAEANHYTLARVVGGSPLSTHYYYVRPGFADSQAIIQGIRNVNYFWFDTGNIGIDYTPVQ